MTGREPGKRNWRNDWPVLGFLDRTLDDEQRFERFKELCRLLMPLVMLVIVLTVVCVLVGVLALAHVDVIGGYYRLTPRADGWQRWGIPSGSISVALIGIKASRKYRSRRAASLERKATAEAVAANAEENKSLPRRGKAPKLGPDKTANEGNDAISEPGARHGDNKGNANPDSDPCSAREA